METRNARAVPDLRWLLQKRLEERCAANPRYSLRAFAKFLQMDSSLLSKILKQKRPVSAKLTLKLGEKLGLSISEIELLKNQAGRRGQSAKDPGAKARKTEYQVIPQDAFDVIADWRHYGILEAMRLKGFENNPKWLAKTLSISVNQAHICIDRLVRVGLLKINEDGSWTDASNGFSTYALGRNYSSYAGRKHQRELLLMAIDALESVPVENRDQSSIMVATSADRIQEAKRRIQEFRRELSDFLGSAPVNDTLYQLSISLYPLSGVPREEKNNEKFIEN